MHLNIESNLLKNTSLISKGKMTIWKPINIRENPKKHHPPPTNANIKHLQEHGQKSTRKTEIFAEQLSEVFCPQNYDQDQEVEQDLAAAIQSQESLK